MKTEKVKCNCGNVMELEIIKDFEQDEPYVNDTCLVCGVNICELISDIENETI